VGTNQPQRLDVGRMTKIVRDDPSIMREFREYLKFTLPESFLAYYVMSTEQVKVLAENANRNTDDHPLLEFHAPRQLFEETRDLNMDLLYQHKGGLIPPGAEVPDFETAYRALVEPFLAMGRENLANQAMGMLGQAERKDPSTLHVALARINLDSGNLQNAQDSLTKASASQRPEGDIYAETQELWGTFYEKGGAVEDAINSYAKAAMADPQRAFSIKKLAELNAQAQSWGEAARWMEKYIALQPREIGHSWALLGDYRLANQDPELAVKALETSITVDPYTYWAHWRMARLFEERKDTDNAIREYEFIMKYGFDRDADIYLNLAKLYQSVGRPKDVRRVLTKGRRIFPTNSAIYSLYNDAVE
jgi:tetratricopeptide (TPR) repeat protein